jgi:hypothetical protein
MSLTKIASGAALVAAVAAGAAFTAVPANAATAVPAATTSASAAASTPSTGLFVRVTSPEVYTPDSRPVISGQATPNADVYITIPGFPVYYEKVHSDAQGHWQYRLTRATSGAFTGNTVTVVGAGDAQAQASFAFHAEYPTPTLASAAFRPITVASTTRQGDGSYGVSGTATPGALVVVRARGLTQGVTLADASGAWSTRVGADGSSTWPQTAAYQQHASGSSSVAFVLAR